ncbi:hypothetical protein LINPERHAP2_LOCUS9968 [Linum perenne]
MCCRGVQDPVLSKERTRSCFCCSFDWWWLGVEVRPAGVRDNECAEGGVQIQYCRREELEIASAALLRSVVAWSYE